MTTKNLWGDLPSLEEISIPAVLLNEQAKALSEQTQRFLEGRIEFYNLANAADEIASELVVIAPLLDNYRVSVVRVTHGAEPYPAKITNLLEDQSPIICHNNTDFEKELSRILQSSKVRRVIGSLWAQSRSAQKSFPVIG